jgi:hypothetical protein
VAEEQAVRAPDRERERQQELGDRDGDERVAVLEVALHAGVEGLADAVARLHDPFAVDLGQVMVGQQEMHLVGEVALELGGLVKHQPGVLRPAGVEVIAVDQLVEDEVALRVAAEVRGADELLEVRAVVVDVAGHPHFARFGQRDELMFAERAELVLIAGRAERLDHLVGVVGHGCASGSASFLREHYAGRSRGATDA